MASNERFPMQADCDPENPDEHFLWAVTQIPMGQEMMPVSPNLARAISNHLYQCGFRHNPELQTKKQQRPWRGQQHSMNGMGRWVPMDAEEPEPVVLPNVSAMTNHERQLIVEELRNIGFIKDPPKERGKVAYETSLAKLASDHVTTVSELLSRGQVRGSES